MSGLVRRLCCVEDVRTEEAMTEKNSLSANFVLTLANSVGSVLLLLNNETSRALKLEGFPLRGGRNKLILCHSRQDGIRS